jgi:hypothetical protein
MNITGPKSDIWLPRYGLPKFFGELLVEGHMEPMWVHLVHAISRFLPPIGKVHPPSKPIVRLTPHLTHMLEENSTFDTLASKDPFLFFTHVLQSPKFSISRSSPKSLHVDPAFRPFILATILLPKPLESQSLESQ